MDFLRCLGPEGAGSGRIWKVEGGCWVEFTYIYIIMFHDIYIYIHTKYIIETKHPIDMSFL